MVDRLGVGAGEGLVTSAGSIHLRKPFLPGIIVGYANYQEYTYSK